MDLARRVLRLNTWWLALEADAAMMPADAPSDCCLWAVRQARLHGGAVIVRDSAYDTPTQRWKHVQWWAPDGSIWEYEPDEPKHQQITVPTLYMGHPRKLEDT